MKNGIEQDLPVFDGHNDTLLRLTKAGTHGARSFIKGSNEGHIDLPGAKKGGMIGGIFAICVPAPDSSEESDPMYGFTITETGYDVKLRSPIDRKYAIEFTESALDVVRAIEHDAKGDVRTVLNYEDIGEFRKRDIFSIVLHFEGADVINKDLSNLYTYYERGLRSLGLVWSRPNEFGNGVPYRFPHSPDTGPGLTPSGKDLVRECNRLGIMIDLSHINEKGFWDVANITQAPLVVTHTNVFSLCHSTRNVTDEQIRAVGLSNGVIGISFVPENLNPHGKPDPDTPLSMIADHIDYVAREAGIDHVAFGSDFDGAELPDAINDVTKLPELITTLKNKGYSSESLEKITYRNWLRVFKDTWKPM
jgi:membrane dipeptidase